jgi:uncharacterized RDD family membrane protein YckC
MAEEELIVRGLTGVDMSLRVAGPGTRSYAFLIDWQIRLLVALALILVGLMMRLLPGAPHSLTNSVWITAIVLATLVYFLYHPVLEVLMRGRTPGKHTAGARIVTLEGGIPTIGSLLMRNLFRLIDCLPGFYMVGLGCCIFTDRRVRLGDMVAGTVLVLEETDAALKSLARLGEAVQRSALPLEALRLIQDLLDRWRDLEEGRRARLARDLLARLDPGFDLTPGTPLSEDALRNRLEALLGARS